MRDHGKRSWWPGPSYLIGVTIASALLQATPLLSVEARQPAEEERKRPIKPPGQATIGDLTTCPVHPEAAFTVSKDTPKAEYKGRVYYFCCSHCVAKFAERPGQFVE